MKRIITATALFFSLAAFGQEKKDTVKVYEKYDTAKAVILYPGTANVVKYAKGYIVLKGFAAKNEKGYYWTEKPVIFAVLDEKKKQIKEWFQIL